MCKHYNARINGDEVLGLATCPDCGEHPFIHIVINNWLDRLAECHSTHR